MRVVQLTSSFPRWDGDVSGLFIRDAAAALVDAGVEVDVVAPHDAGASTREELGGIRVRRFRYAPDGAEVLAHRGGLLAEARRPERALLLPCFLAAFAWSAWQAVRGRKPDVVHAHWWFPAGLLAVPICRLTNTPLVITLHGSDVHIARSRALRPIARWVLQQAAVVGVVSEALRAEAIAELGVDPARCDVLRMPVMVDDVATSLDAAPPPPPLRLVAVGRFAPEKGFDVLLAALRDVDAELDVFGAGTEVLTGGSVRGHGARPRAEIADALSRAHALVVPSRREGLGLVALEALAAGRPVIASRVGGLIETVEDGVDGLLVEPDDPVALATALRRLPLPAPAGRAVERHRPAVIARRHLAAYSLALSARRR